MRLTRIDTALDSCGNHIRDTGSAGTEIEAFLTRYLLVLICAAFEEEVESLVIERASESGDGDVANFIRSAVDALFRSPKTSDIRGLLNRFGLDYGTRFRQALDNNLKAETYFNNIITNRHDTAHSTGSNVTFDELVEFYTEGHVVLDAVKSALITGS